MPSSYHGFINEVIDVYLPTYPQKVLDIGVGFGKWGFLFREYGDIFRGNLKPENWKIEINGIEAFPNYKTPNYDYVYNNVIFDDILNVYQDQIGYDFVFAGDVIEHLEKEDALKVINFLKNNNKIVVISIPLTDVWAQGEVFGNKYEEHKSVWFKEDFPDFEQQIKTNPRGKPIGLFIYKKV